MHVKVFGYADHACSQLKIHNVFDHADHVCSSLNISNLFGFNLLIMHVHS